MLFRMQYDSPVGCLTLAGDANYLKGLWIEGQKYFGEGAGESCIIAEQDPVLASARDWLDRYFAGARPSPGELPLSPQGSAFRQRVWEALCEIPYGTTVSYGELARKLGTAPRAVGGAVGLPCHRVLGAGGSLTGYAGGVAAKRILLLHEGIRF